MKKEIKTLKQEVLDVLTQNILPFWLDKMQDREHGGFYGQMTGRYELNREADKGAILNARILWSFSAAYRVLSHLSPHTPHLSQPPPTVSFTARATRCPVSSSTSTAVWP